MSIPQDLIDEFCEGTSHLSASTTPESDPVYVFKKIKEVKGIFKPEYQVGEITLRHFCKVKIGKRKRASKSPESSETKKLKRYAHVHLRKLLITICTLLFSHHLYIIYTKVSFSGLKVPEGLLICRLTAALCYRTV